jgi:hypothetical protein
MAVVTLWSGFDGKMATGIAMTVFARAWRDTRTVSGCGQPGSRLVTDVARLTSHLMSARFAGCGHAMAGKAGAGGNTDMTKVGREPRSANRMAGLAGLTGYRMTGCRLTVSD